MITQLYIIENRDVKKFMLSRDCDGCSQLKPCKKRYKKVIKGDKVYCPDGTVHLVDEEFEYFIQNPCIEIREIR